MALSAAALTTLATLKDELGISDSSEDTRLERFIEQASAMIAAYLGRTLHYESAVVEKVAGDGTEHLLVKRPPVKAITSIALDGVTVDSGDYEIYDADAGIIYNVAGWDWTTVRTADGVARPPLAGSERRLYTVTYAGGWECPTQSGTGATALPKDIEAAAISLAVTLRARRGRDRDIASESMMSYSVSFKDASTVKSGLPADVAAMLDPYKFLVQA